MKRLLAPGGALLVGAGLLLAASVQGQVTESYSATLSGANEVPPAATSTTSGSATFHVMDDDTIHYILAATSTNETLTAAHLHCAPTGQNGPVVVPLALATSTATSSEGTIDAGDITDNCTGIDTIPQLVQSMRQGGIYANVHSVPFPNGTARGQLTLLGTTTPPGNGTSTPTTTPTTTPPTSGDADDLIDELEDLQDEFPQFFWNLQWLINDLMDEGTSTPPAQGTPSIDNNGTTVSPGGHLNFGGRNFGREETVNITLNGVLLRTAHADGGGNFSTGSMSAPITPGTYTYVFTGQSSGRTANSVITVQ
jgi:hypothetical protein